MDGEYLFTDSSEIPNIVNSLRTNFYAITPTSYSYRITQLKQLLKFLDECQDELLDACIHYYGGHKTHHWLTRLWAMNYFIHYAIKNLSNWIKSDTKSQSFPYNLMWSASVEYHPLGVTAIISPWNFPLSLLLRPLIGAIAAGNAVILKPSEITDRVARVLHKKLSKYLDPKLVQIVCGGPHETNVLLQQKLDFVMFTGGTSIGKLVMKACAANLTPCCLELGGKNPVIIDDNADLEVSLKRIIFGRFDMNCGQICIAPEMIFVSKQKQKEVIAILRKCLLEFYGKDGDTESADSYYNIVNTRHFDRINKIRRHYLDTQPDKIAIGGADDAVFGPAKVNRNTRHLPPMVLCDIDANNEKIMEAEVFGPILSIIPMEGSISTWHEDVIRCMRRRDKPLVCYLFTRDANSDVMKRLRNSISAGSICVNDTMMFNVLNDVPFGGVGESGMGRYGGEYSFKTFSQPRAVAIRSHGLEFLHKDRYPNPNTNSEQLKKVAQRFKYLYPKRTSTLKSAVTYFGVLGAITALIWIFVA